MNIGLGIGVGYYPSGSGTGWTPAMLPNLAFDYDLSQASTVLKSTGAIAGNGDSVALWGDVSGQSPVNCLCLNGASGNYASTPDSAAISFTGDFFIVGNLHAADWNSGNNLVIASKDDFSTNRSYYFYNNSRFLVLRWWPTGAAASQISVTSTAQVSFTTFTNGWVAVTLDVDNGAGGYDVKFWTSTDGTTWTQLGTTVTGGSTTSVFDGTHALEVGSNSGTSAYSTGNYFRVYCGAGTTLTGTKAFDANFALPAKLDTSFTESSSNAATVTINTSGDLGARISGERDLVQLTAAKMPVLTISGASRYLTFDGSNDYMKTPAFSLSQPESVYFVGSQVSWTNNDYVFDGNALAGGNVVQTGVTPSLSAGAGAALVLSPSLAVGTNGVITTVFNSTSSAFRLNLNSAVMGNLGTNNMSGLTVGASGNIVTFSNITTSEIAGYAAAHSTAIQNQVIAYEMTKWGVT